MKIRIGEDYLSILETLEILSDNDAVEQLRRSIKKVTEGKQIPWTKAKTRLGTSMGTVFLYCPGIRNANFPYDPVVINVMDCGLISHNDIILGEALQIAFALPVRWSEVDHPAVMRLALNIHLTTYDACYLYLSKKLGVPMVTFDQQLALAALTGSV